MTTSKIPATVAPATKHSQTIRPLARTTTGLLPQPATPPAIRALIEDALVGYVKDGNMTLAIAAQRSLADTYVLTQEHVRLVIMFATRSPKDYVEEIAKRLYKRSFYSLQAPPAGHPLAAIARS